MFTQLPNLNIRFLIKNVQELHYFCVLSGLQIPFWFFFSIQQTEFLAQHFSIELLQRLVEQLVLLGNTTRFS